MPINQIKDQHKLSLKHQDWLVSKFKNVEGHIVKLNNVLIVLKLVYRILRTIMD